MRIPRIYTGQLLQANTEVALEKGPGRHLSRVLRLKVGDALVLFNGRGGQYPARISSLDRNAVVAATGDFQAVEHESGLNLQLGIGLSRGERMDWVVQKSTELGVSCIAPLVTERTEVRLSAERADKKLRHWRQVAISACEQCGRNTVPRVLAPQALPSWLQSVQADARLVLHHAASNSGPDMAGPGAALPGAALPGAALPGSAALLVGPEGGLSGEELGAAKQTGFDALRLGPRVLRTETAPLAAIAILQARWGDMG